MKYKLEKLNELELSIHLQLQQHLQTNPDLKIIEASNLCQVSPSKISKFCQKIGFSNYKQYKEFVQTGKIASNSSSFELERLSNYIKSFDNKKATKLARLITKHDRIILHGIGPSLIAVEYFAYRLRIHTKKDIITTSDDFFINTNINNKTLAIIYSVTGTFRSFKPIINTCEGKKTEYIIVCEEQSNQPDFTNKKVLFLTDSTQDMHQLAYEKTRTIWFIFIEEVISKIVSLQD